jgi:hypothetical protein
MFHRVMMRRRLTFLKRLGALAGLVVVVGTTFALALQLAAEARFWQVSDGGKKPVVRVVSPNLIGTVTAPSVSAAIGTMAPVETAPEVENSATTGRSSADAMPVARSAAGVPRVVSPRTRAEVPARFRSRPAESQPAVGLGLSRQEKSYIGAGRAFDAVH